MRRRPMSGRSIPTNRPSIMISSDIRGGSGARSEGPALPVLSAEEGFGLRAVRGLEVRSIPLDLLARPIGHVAQQDGLGQGARVVEVAGGRTAVLAGGDPFGVVADRLGDRGRGGVVVLELVFGEQPEAVVIGLEHPLVAD